jgi:hypothetical protein
LSIDPSVIELLRAVSQDIVCDKEKNIQSQEKVHKKQLTDIEKQIDSLQNRIFASEEVDVISFYETKLSGLLRDKKILE